MAGSNLRRARWGGGRDTSPRGSASPGRFGDATCCTTGRNPAGSSGHSGGSRRGRRARGGISAFELALRTEVVVGDVGPAMGLDSSEVVEQERHRLGDHRRAPGPHEWSASLVQLRAGHTSAQSGAEPTWPSHGPPSSRRPRSARTHLWWIPLHKHFEKPVADTSPKSSTGAMALDHNERAEA